MLARLWLYRSFVVIRWYVVYVYLTLKKLKFQMVIRNNRISTSYPESCGKRKQMKGNRDRMWISGKKVSTEENTLNIRVYVSSEIQMGDKKAMLSTSYAHFVDNAMGSGKVN